MLQETFCYGDVLYGDVLSTRRFVRRRFVCAALLTTPGGLETETCIVVSVLSYTEHTEVFKVSPFTQVSWDIRI
jgi:hypothetical protein